LTLLAGYGMLFHIFNFNTQCITLRNAFFGNHFV